MESRKLIHNFVPRKQQVGRSLNVKQLLDDDYTSRVETCYGIEENVRNNVGFSGGHKYVMAVDQI